MSKDLSKEELLEAQELFAQTKLDNVELSAMLLEVRLAADKVDDLGGVSKSIIENHLKGLDVNLNMFTVNPSMVGLESFHSALVKLVGTAVKDFVKTNIKAVNMAEKILRRKIPKNAFKFGLVDSEQVTMLKEEYEYTALTEAVLYNPTVLIKEMMNAQPLIYSDMLNNIIDVLEQINKEFSKPISLSNVDSVTENVLKQVEVIKTKNKLVRETLSETASVSSGMGLNTLAGTLSDHVKGLMAQTPNEALDVEKALVDLKENGLSKTLIESVDDPYLYIADKTKRKMYAIEEELGKILTNLVFDKSVETEAGVRQLVSGLEDVLGKITSNITFITTYSLVLMDALDECEDILSYLEKAGK